MTQTLIPAAGYLRMSSDKQDASIDLDIDGTIDDAWLTVLAELLIDLAEEPTKVQARE